MGSDLDPMNGMYWTWQSGYINVKLEGKSNRCQTRNHIFQYHIGGYTLPFYPIQHLGFKLNQKKDIKFRIDIEKIMDNIDISKLNEIMSPRKEAVEISKIISNSYSVE